MAPIIAGVREEFIRYSGAPDEALLNPHRTPHFDLPPESRSTGTVAAAIFAGGCIGVFARAGLGELIPATTAGWPWATFIANLAGTVLLAAVATALHERPPRSIHLRPFLGTGVCGALTTFSTLQVEVIRLTHHGHAALAAAYLLVSLVAGLGAMQAVTTLARRPAT